VEALIKGSVSSQVPSFLEVFTTQSTARLTTDQYRFNRFSIAGCRDIRSGVILFWVVAFWGAYRFRSGGGQLLYCACSVLSI